MKKYIIMAVMMLLTMSFVACSENEPMAYEGYPALYFDNKDINYSFFYATSDADRNEVEITVHAMGNVTDYDRAFTLYQKNVGEADAAEAGVHYVGVLMITFRAVSSKRTVRRFSFLPRPSSQTTGKIGIMPLELVGEP